MSKKLSSQFSNIRRTRFDHSSPFQLVSEIQKSQKISKNPFFFSSSFFSSKNQREKNAILLVFQHQEDAIQPELSSPPRFRIQGRDGRTKDKGRISLCLIINTFGLRCHYIFHDGFNVWVPLFEWFEKNTLQAAKILIRNGVQKGRLKMGHKMASKNGI